MPTVRIVLALGTALILASGCRTPDLPIPSMPGPMLRLKGDGHLPKSGFAAGWARAGDLRRFSARTLDDHIGRHADLVRSYGFEYLATADYARPDDERPVLTIESYEMSARLAARGLYHHYRGNRLPRLGKEVLPADVGAEAVRSGDGRLLYFYKDVYLFKILYTGPGGEGPEMAELGRAVARDIPGQSRPPRGFHYLAVDGVDASTAKVTAGNTFNYDFLPPAILARAPGAGAIAQVLLIGHYSEKQARKTAEMHRSWMEKNGSEFAVRRVERGRLAWRGRDPGINDERLLMTQHGRWVIGVRGPKTYEKGHLVLDRIINNIRGR